jgi:hypothetical protein
MRENNFVGWSALVLFVLGVVLMVLAVFYPLQSILNPQAALFVTCILAFLATVTGFCAFKTSAGKVAGIGGLTLLCAIGLFLSLFMPVERPKAIEQPQPVDRPAQPRRAS